MRALAMVAAVGAALSLVPMVNQPVAQADGSGPLVKLVDDAAQRLQTADPVAASKYLTGGDVDDPVREEQVLDSVTAAARNKHVDSHYVHDAFRDQIDATDSLEHSRFAEWKIDPMNVPKAAPDLSTSRDAINGLNRAMVDDFAEQWNVLHSSACVAELDDAKAAVIAQRHLDQLYQQALDYALHRYCQ